MLRVAPGTVHNRLSTRLVIAWWLTKEASANSRDALLTMPGAESPL